MSDGLVTAIAEASATSDAEHIQGAAQLRAALEIYAEAIAAKHSTAVTEVRPEIEALLPPELCDR